MNTEHTYMRAPAPKGARATCPLCCRLIKVNSKGRMVRHGWNESGRRVGQTGLGFQWGECPGTGDRPLEQTDADGLKHVRTLDKAAEGHEQMARLHRAGFDHYDFTHDTETRTLEYDMLANFLSESGMELVKEYEREDKRNYHTYHRTVRVYRVLRGFQGRYGADYEKIRASHERASSHKAEQLRAAETMLYGKIEHHREAPVECTVEKSVERPVHFGGHRFRARCGSRGATLKFTSDRAEVTCSRCRKAMGL